MHETPDWSAPQRFALILAAIVFIPFWNVILGFETFGLRDFGLFSIPTAYFQRECFWRGELPLWNPYNCCGLPFLAQFNTLSPLSALPGLSCCCRWPGRCRCFACYIFLWAAWECISWPRAGRVTRGWRAGRSGFRLQRGDAQYADVAEP